MIHTCLHFSSWVPGAPRVDTLVPFMYCMNDTNFLFATNNPYVLAKLLVSFFTLDLENVWKSALYSPTVSLHSSWHVSSPPSQTCSLQTQVPHFIQESDVESAVSPQHSF